MSTTKTNNIPFIDLQAQYKRIGPQIDAAMQRVVAHGKFIMGPEIAQLEEELAAFAGTECCVSCSSGTDALLMALMVYDIGPGDAVFVPTFTFIATAEVVSLLGATPVFVDIEPDTYNIAPADLERRIRHVRDNTDLTPRAIIPVDLFGLPADYDAITAIAEQHDLTVIEDAAQSFGASRDDHRAGSLGDIAATSFFPAKPLGCYGDGGAVFTDDPQAADILKSIRVHGKGDHKYSNVRIGLNARIDTLQAAVLLEKLKVYADEIGKRQQVAAHYNTALAEKAPDLTTPVMPDNADATSVWAQYTVRGAAREKLQGLLREQGIPTAIYYPKPLHLQAAFESLGYKPGDFPTAEAASEQVFSLPFHPYLESDTIDYIAETLGNAMDN